MAGATSQSNKGGALARLVVGGVTQGGGLGSMASQSVRSSIQTVRHGRSDEARCWLRARS